MMYIGARTQSSTGFKWLWSVIVIKAKKARSGSGYWKYSVLQWKIKYQIFEIRTFFH